MKKELRIKAHKDGKLIISALVHKAFMIWFKSKLQTELHKIGSILITNGYWVTGILINFTFIQKINELNAKLVCKVKKCPVYLLTPWIKIASTRFEKQINIAVKQCRYAVEPRVVFAIRKLWPATKKDLLPSHHCNSVIYQFLCHVMVGALVARPKACKRILNKTFPNLLLIFSPFETTAVIFAPAKLTVALNSPVSHWPVYR